MRKRLYVWEFPVRATHWVNALCVAVLSVSGYYVGSPFIHTASPDAYAMGWMRFAHFVFSYLFAVSILVRTYWSLVGNEYSSIKEFLYFTPRKFADLTGDVRYYILMKKGGHRSRTGHSALASVVYFILWVLFFVEIVTGFALYSQSHAGGFLWTVLGGWLLSLFSSQAIRLVHHLIMWAIVFFLIEHVYISWITREERGGFISSILSGYKAVEEK